MRLAIPIQSMQAMKLPPKCTIKHWPNVYDELRFVNELLEYFRYRKLNFIDYVYLLQLLKDKGEDAKKIGIMVASHNEDTVRFAIEKMKEIGISPEDKVICFGQLLGMCDYITMPLGQAG